MSDLIDDPVAKASELGLALILPKPDELFLDIDSAEDMAHLDRMLDLIARAAEGLQIDRVRTTTSHGGNSHVYLRFPRALTPIERIAWQAALGSDRKREVLSILRIELALNYGPTVFFETPAEADRIAQEEMATWP